MNVILTFIMTAHTSFICIGCGLENYSVRCEYCNKEIDLKDVSSFNAIDNKSFGCTVKKFYCTDCVSPCVVCKRLTSSIGQCQKCRTKDFRHLDCVRHSCDTHKPLEF